MAVHDATIAANFDAICARVSDGEFTRPVLRELGVPKRAFYHWLEAHPDKGKVYQDAKDDGEEMVITDCIAIADEPTKQLLALIGDVKRLLTEGDAEGAKEALKALQGFEADNPESVQRSKLRGEMRLKALAKFNPKKWGDKVDLTVDATVRGSVSYQANLPPRD